MDIALTIIFGLITIPPLCVVVALRLGAAFPSFGYRMRVAWVWVVTRVFPGFWRWLEAKNWDPVRRYYAWLERDPAEQRGEIDA
jgi:hypothetical protein